jgi:hypothetical protein
VGFETPTRRATGDPSSESAAFAPLRLALLVDSETQPLWVRTALERALREADARIVAVAINQGAEGGATAAPRRSRIGRWVANRDSLLHALHRRLDRWRFPARRSPFEPVDISDLLAGAVRIPVATRRTSFSDYFPDEAVAALRDCSIDVAVRLGFRILRGDALCIARHGVWSYHHGDKQTNRGGPPAYWEVMEENCVTGAMLQVLNEQLDDGRVLAEGWVRTDPFSVGRNAAQLYWMAEPFLARALVSLATERMASDGAAGPVGPAGAGAKGETGPEVKAPVDASVPMPSAYSRRLYRVPDNRSLVRPLARLCARYASRHATHLLHDEQWFIAYDTRPLSTRAFHQLAPYAWRRFMPPPGTSWADPFPVLREERRYLFFEEFHHADQKGRIRVSELGGDGQLTTPTTVLELPHHLAYPLHLAHGGADFLVPECATQNAIEVWKARAFPHDWTLEHRMLEGAPWVDSTIVPWRDGWVLFAGLDCNARGDWDELHVFFAGSPFGPWRPHRRNPVVVDVRSARPAGLPFVLGGTLYRPAQDGSYSYGSSLRLQRVTTLTATDYAEETVAHLHPSWEPRLVGTHTFNHVPGFSVIDVRRRVGRLAQR